MNNHFSQNVSDIIAYSKEEANRLRNDYIGPEHLLLGLIRYGQGKAIDILMELNINLIDIKNKTEKKLKVSLMICYCLMPILPYQRLQHKY